MKEFGDPQAARASVLERPLTTMTALQSRSLSPATTTFCLTPMEVASPEAFMGVSTHIKPFKT